METYDVVTPNKIRYRNIDPVTMRYFIKATSDLIRVGGADNDICVTMRDILARVKQYGESIPANYDKYIQFISNAFRQKGWQVEKGLRKDQVAMTPTCASRTSKDRQLIQDTPQLSSCISSTVSLTAQVKKL